MSPNHTITMGPSSGTKKCLLCGHTIASGNNVVHLSMRLKVLLATIEKHEEIHTECARLFALDIHRIIDGHRH